MKKIWLISFMPMIIMPMSYQEWEWEAHKKKKIETEVKIVDAVTTALKNFDINPNSIDIATEPALYDLPKWSCNSSGVLIAEDMAIDPSLLTFVSHCAAADIKNWGYSKKYYAPITSMFGPTIIGDLAAFVVPTEYQIPVVLGGIACSLSSVFWARALDNTTDAYFTKQAYVMACKKLIKNNKQLKPISVYLAYTHKWNHEPLTSNQKKETIRKALKDEGYYATLRLDETGPKDRYKSICAIYSSYSLRPLDVSEIVFTDEENPIITSIQ